MSSLQIHSLPAGLFEIRTSYFSKALNEACKLVPGMRWSPESRNWYGYSDAIEQLREELSEKGVSLGGELPEADAWKSRDITTVNLTASNGWVARRYQEDGVRFILDKAEEGCLLADGMRLGKSATAALAARHLDVKTLVICPPNAVGVWAREPDHTKPGELAKWWPEAWRGLDDKPWTSKTPYSGVVVLEGIALAKWQDAFWKISEKKEEKRSTEEKQKLKEADAILNDTLKDLQNAKVAVIHDQLIYAWVEVLTRWGFDFVVMDECHVFSSYDTRRSLAAKKLTSRARYRASLSGTPMTNRPRDLHNVVDLLCPGRFGAFFRHEKQKGTFSDSFCGSFQETVGKGPEAKTVWNHNGKSNAELLHRRLQRMMLRRTAKEVDTELPDKTRQIIDVRVPANKMVMPSMSNLGDRRALRRVLDLTADAKLKSVQDLLKSHLEEGLKVIAFCHRQVFAETLVSGSMKFDIDNLFSTYVHGDVSSKNRIVKIISAEKNTGPVLFAATIESCSSAIDLSFADVIVFCELTYEPGELAQCLDAKTEILTPYGFVPMGTIQKGDRVAAFNMETEEVAYLKASSVIQRDLGKDEFMYRLASDDVEIHVTGDHRMVNKRHIKGPNTNRWTAWETNTAKELSKRNRAYTIPVAGNMTACGVPLTDDELRVIGWYLTDGTLNGNTLSISQSTGSAYLKDLEACLHGACLAFGVSVIPADPEGIRSNMKRTVDGHVYSIPRFASRKREGTGWYKLAAYLDKNFAPSLFDMTKEQLAVLLEALHWGNGVKSKGKRTKAWAYHIGTSNKTFIERLQHLCILRGFRANISTDFRDRGDREIGRKPYYTLNVKDCAWRSLGGPAGGDRTRMARLRKRPQKVWCVSNDWGTLIIRRNGKTAIVGNCEERSYKVGDGRKRLIQYVIARGTGDELILRAVISKLADFETIVGSTGDRMKEDLAGKKDPDAALKRLAAAMEEMHKAKPKLKKSRGISAT